MNVKPEWLAGAAMTAVTLAMFAVTAAIALDASTSDYDLLEASARGLMVAAPLGVGFYARTLRTFDRFGDMLVIAGVGWFLAGFAASDDELLYSIGRVSGWVVEVGLIYLVLAFPSGVLGRVDRALVLAMALVVALLYLPTALLVEHYPTPSPWTSCGDDCPGNAFMVTSSEPGFVGDFMQPLRELLTVAIFTAATLRLGWRIKHASRILRRTLAPVLSVAMFRLAALAVGTVAREVAPDSTFTEVVAWLIALALPALALAFLVGLLRWRLFMAVAIERLASRLRGHPGPEQLRSALGEAFEDDSLDVVYWLDDPQGHWADGNGHARDTVSTGPGVTEILDGDRRVAAIIHDPALGHDAAFVDTAGSYAAIAIDNHRLSAQTGALLREVRESRARIQAAADYERRRIEHDLHDGAQQRLVTLRIKLELGAEQAAADGDASTAGRLRALGREIDEALDEVRSLARGIYPAPLAARGLVEALRAAALRTSLPTTVLAAGIGRYSREIEAAAYFCCLEAMQNAAKHAAGATAAVIELSDNGSLTLDVRDDGAGFEMAHVNGGVGFTSMRDRLAAVGGRLVISSGTGRGTHVTGVIPLDGQGPL
jgi:signal transduction histidine kinase